MDMVGPLPVQVHKGERYFLTIVDNWSRLMWAYPLNQKDHAASTIREDWLPFVEKQAECVVKRIRTDRSERANWTIMETARALLIESGVGNSMLPHAVRHATMARNRVLTKVGNESWVPLERWLGRKPPVDMLRVFVCMAVAHVPKKYRSKLGASAICKDVKFVEGMMYGGWKKQPETKVSQQMEQITMQLNLTPSVWEEGEEAAAEGGDGEKVHEAPGGGGDVVETSGSTKEAAGSEGGEQQQGNLSCDESLFLKGEGEKLVLFLVYVDDILLFSSSMKEIQKVQQQLMKNFKCKTLGEVKYYLGMHVERDLDHRWLKLHQEKLIKELGEKYGIENERKVATPLPAEFKLVKAAEDEGVEADEQQQFQSLVGSLVYAAVHTRPDISFSVGQLARVVQNPSEEQVVKFLNSHPSNGVQYSAFAQVKQKGVEVLKEKREQLGEGKLFLTCFTDAMWASEKDDSSSVGGYICVVGGGPVSPSALSLGPLATAADAPAATAAPESCATMAGLLAFDPEGRPVAFDTWHDDLQLYLLSDSKDSVLVFDQVSSAAPAPPTTADEHRTAHALYDAVVARYSSLATTAIGRLLLPYLFPELLAFATVADMITHLRTSDARYCATVPAEFLPTNQPPMFITLYFMVTRLPVSLRSVRDHFLTLDLTSLTVDLLEQHLLAAETSAVAVVRSAATARARVAGVVEEAAVVVEVDVGAVVEAAVEEVEAVEVVAAVGLVAAVEALVAAVEAAEGVAAVEAVGPVVVGLDLGVEALVVVGAISSSVGARPRPARIAKGDCYRCMPLDPRIAAAALGASASGTPPGTGPAEALHTFTLDFGASRCFFRDSTTLTPLPAPVLLRLADPFGGPVVARSSTVLPCPAVPPGSLSNLYLLSFSTNLMSTAALQDAMVTTTTLGGQRVSICTCTRTGRHLATFTCRPGSSQYTLATGPPQVAASAQVSTSGQVAASCSCRLLSHQTLPWHHRLGHPSLPRLRGLHSRLLVSGLPRSLPPLPPSLAPPCLPCVEGRQRAAPHSSSFPPTTAPLQTLDMDVKGEVFDVLIPWIQLRERFGQDLLVLRLHSERGGEFSSELLRNYCRGEGITQSFTLPDSPQQNGIAERRIGSVMEVAHTSMIHAATPHFLWPFAVQYAAHQLNLWPSTDFGARCIARNFRPPDIPTPRSYVEAITGPYSSQWQAAMDAEMASWKSTGTYVDEVPPPGVNIVDGMWIFRVKRPPGSPPAFKARYVARGFSQRLGVDYFQTFSPTPKMTTLRVSLHVASQRDYELHSLDFSTAFLQGSLHEEIWLRRPPGFTGTFPAGIQWSLRQPVYGLRQAPCEWHDTLRTTLAALGFAPSTAEPLLFLRTDTSLPSFYVLVYVDDLVFATADTEALTLVKSELQKRLTCTDLGELRNYLGLQITRDRARCTITLTQSHIVHQVLQPFSF
ncbi:unnamed protein product [Closterium sp. NIES-54]